MLIRRRPPQPERRSRPRSRAERLAAAGVPRRADAMLAAGAGAEELVALGVPTSGRGHRMPKEICRALGPLREGRVLEMLRTGMAAHPWMLAVRRATPAEDTSGVDIVVATVGVGDIYVQVKSSTQEAAAWRRRYLRAPIYPRTALVVFDPADPESTRLALFDGLAAVYERLAERRRPSASSHW